METIREKLIDAIMDLASDEFETVKDVVSLAKMSSEQLALEVISIANYYRDNVQ
jgi:hypothetical protein